MTRSSTRRAFRVALASALALGGALLPVSAADAATDTGWVRLTHLSPDTAAVNVTLTDLRGGPALFRLKNVGYGAVSPYLHLKAGTYAIAMAPSGHATSAAIVTASVEVKAGTAETVAAMGPNAHLVTKVFADDLDGVAGSSVRVRVVQASTRHDAVDVRAGSAVLASAQRFGTVSDYTTVPAGAVDLTIQGGSTTATAKRTFAAGTVHTVFVLDRSGDALAVGSVQDSAASAIEPAGAIETGGGALARTGELPVAGTAVVAALAAAACVGLLLRRRRVLLG